MWFLVRHFLCVSQGREPVIEYRAAVSSIFVPRSSSVLVVIAF